MEIIMDMDSDFLETFFGNGIVGKDIFPMSLEKQIQIIVKGIWIL